MSWTVGGLGAGIGLVPLAHAHRVHHDEAVLDPGARGDRAQFVWRYDADPTPFICSKKPADLTLRMKNTHSMGFTSVPVEIMSTVTAIRGKKLLRKVERISSGERLDVFTHSVTSISLPSSSVTVFVTLVKRCGR